ncbi:MAG: PQQ-dependent sugar dehydrogenase [Verrucomicrobia bacterium]|nr:PQQ-dependent sugar dehydrogenase [Verrucomicrobiota bacterium]
MKPLTPSSPRRWFAASLVGFFLALLALAVGAAEKKDAAKSDKPKKIKVTKPARHDEADIPFRCAPMSNAVRSIHIPLATNLHVAFDAEMLRTHVAWEGGMMNLWGAPYHEGKDRFYCEPNGKVLWTMPPVFPWAFGELPGKPATAAPQGARFVGIITTGAVTTLTYEVPVARGFTVVVRETPQPTPDGHGIRRVVRIHGGNADGLWWLVHVVPSTERLEIDGPAKADLVMQRAKLSIDERVWSEVKNESEPSVRPFGGEFQLVWWKVPKRAPSAALTVDTTSHAGGVRLTVADAEELNPLPVRTSKRKVFSADKGFPIPAGDSAYRLEHFPVPKEIELGVTGMDFLPNGDLAVCTWLGDVFIVQKPTGAPSAATYRRFARGLCEPGGLKVIDGDIYVVQKHELTRLRDTDGDGEADVFGCINNSWGFTGNYHDFSFGPTLDCDGNFHVFRIGTHGVWGVPYMGWDIIVKGDGSITPFCSGLRSPDGFGTYQGDIFMTENQGNWQGACKLNHLQRGRFYGYPSTEPATKEQFDNPTKFDPPAIWFPYSRMSKSASGMATIPDDDRFGPFKGQLLVGEFQYAIVMRCFLEKVNGEWQGCVWPFAKNFESGVNRLAFGPDGKLYVGGLKNGAWSAVAAKNASLDRVSFTGKTPFEIKEVHAKSDGFELVFTLPVDSEAAGKADNYDVTQYRTEYHQAYGSAEYDFDGKPDSASDVKVVGVKVSTDKLSVRLQLSGWRAGYVTTLRLLDINGADGAKLRHDTCYYTLNQIPK